jgi:prolyl oligopeptidase
MSRLAVSSLLSIALVACPAPEQTAVDTAPPAGQGAAMANSDDTIPIPPATRIVDVVDQLHGRKVPDPYRWLEDVRSPEVVDWMRAQDGYARDQLEGLPLRADLAKRLGELSYLDSVSAPSHRGDRYFYTRSHRDKEKAIYYVRKGEQGREEVLLDPNTMSSDGSVSVHGVMPSHSGRYLAYKLSRNNADAATMYVRDLDSGKELVVDTIEGARYATAEWTPDDRGFYYVWLPVDPAIPVSELPGRAEVRFHALGTEPSTDPVVYAASGNPKEFVNVDLSRDGRWLFVGHQRGWSASDIHVADLGATKLAQARSKSPEFRPLVVGRDAVYSVQAWRGKFYVFTNDDAARYRVMLVDPRKLERKDWRELVPQSDAVLEGVQIVGERLVLSYLRDAHSTMEVRALSGAPIRQIDLPGLGSASGMVGNPDEDDAYYYYSSFTETPQIFRTSIAKGTTSLWEKVEIPVDTSGFVTEQVWYPSKDGTKVSMFVVRRKDVALDGDNPTMLTGYGGFNVSLQPGFSARAVLWVERGGIWAVPNLRGGGEYGEQWHQDGMRAKKQNVFDDFHAAAEYLIANKYTRTDKLAIMGGSNGGLLVGAAMVQRPDLYGAVVCAVPLLDMVRYHLFGAGKTWIEEYGSAENPREFETLVAYSPYHHVRAGTAYPAMLMLSADSDDRVDPMHARKFTAAIQSAGKGHRAALLRIETNAGHGGADLIKKQIEQSVDTFAFVLHELGVSAAG